MNQKTEETKQSPQYRSMVNRLPEITFLFWIIKLLTTGMGETTSDYLVNEIEIGRAHV
mgnify:CR=1 FL=1